MGEKSVLLAEEKGKLFSPGKPSSALTWHPGLQLSVPGQAHGPWVSSFFVMLTTMESVWRDRLESSLMLLEEGVCYDQYIFLAKLY